MKTPRGEGFVEKGKKREGRRKGCANAKSGSCEVRTVQNVGENGVNPKKSFTDNFLEREGGIRVKEQRKEGRGLRMGAKIYLANFCIVQDSVEGVEGVSRRGGGSERHKGG